MYIDDLKQSVVMLDGQKYEITKLKQPVNLTEQNENIETEATHILKGFVEDLLLVIEEECFYFAHMIGDTGLVVNLEDEEMHEKAVQILMMALEK